MRGNGITRRAALAGLAFAASTSAAFAADQVKVSVYQSVSDAGIYVAEAKGYFKEQGVAIDVVQLDSVSSVVTALASGQVDVAGGAPSAAVYNAARQGIGIRIVADKGSMRKGGGYLCLVVRKGLEDKIKTAADLKGHKVAWSGIGVGTTNEVALDHLLKSAGLKDSDLSLQNLTFGDSFAALASGSVDAAYLIEPLVQSAEQKGVGTLLMTGDQMYPNQQVAVLLYGADFAQKRADVARRFMVAYLKGVRDYNDAFGKGKDRAGIVAILSKNTSVKRPELYEKMVMPGLNPDGEVNLDGMKADMAWFHSKGYLKETIDLSKVVDSSFVDEALKKLGRYQ
ncbi:MAG: ABC transporter substrate-binding protein [Proteobacteria bacterium]|nr:ABC transporter substrate-binding protein [Pseudomonadota bacterium]